MLKILFVGSNPSNKANSNAAFTLDTASGRTLQSWISGIEGAFFYENIVSQKTENNRPLNQSEMALAQACLSNRINSINPDRIVALGEAAAKVLTKTGHTFLRMPHPSGLNRQNNDKEYIAGKCTELHRFCS